MATVLKEIEEYLVMSKSISEGLKPFIDMFSVPGVDTKLGVATSILNSRVEYDKGTSTKIHTSVAFNKFAAMFLDANMAELSNRILMFAHEKLDAERTEAMAEVTDLSLFPIHPPYIPPQSVEVTEGVPFTYTIISAHTTNSLHVPAPSTFAFVGAPHAGLAINATTGVITGAFPIGTSSPALVNVRVTNAGGTVDGVISFKVNSTSGSAIPVIVNPTSGASIALTDGAAMTPVTFTATGLAGATTVVWTLIGGNLPSGTMFNTGTGVISGTPSGTGTSHLVVYVTADGKVSVPVAFNIVVS